MNSAMQLEKLEEVEAEVGVGVEVEVRSEMYSVMISTME